MGSTRKRFILSTASADLSADVGNRSWSFITNHADRDVGESPALLATTRYTMPRVALCLEPRRLRSLDGRSRTPLSGSSALTGRPHSLPVLVRFVLRIGRKIDAVHLFSRSHLSTLRISVKPKRQRSGFLRSTNSATNSFGVELSA